MPWCDESGSQDEEDGILGSQLSIAGYSCTSESCTSESVELYNLRGLWPHPTPI